MEAVYAGIYSLIPPVLTMALALISRNILFSLMSGVLSGGLIYVLLSGRNPLAGVAEVVFDTIAANTDLYVILFCFFLGAVIQILNTTGATTAYGTWVGKRLKSRKMTIFATWFLGLLIQVDDYFHCLTVGTVMGPMADRHRISREKLSYLVDCMAAPVCVLSPISSWAVAIASTLLATGIFRNGFSAFCATIPYNLYPWLTIGLSLFVGLFSLDFGKMRLAECAAAEAAPPVRAPSAAPCRGSAWDVLAVIVTLLTTAILSMMYTGGYWDTDPAFRGLLIRSLGNCSASKALCWSSFAALCVLLLLTLLQRTLRFEEAMEETMNGMKFMLDASALLVLSWTLSAVCRELLLTPDYVKDLLVGSAVPVTLFPAIIFVIASLLSVSMGTAWGTFFILLPIAAPVVSAMEPRLLTVALAATLGGSVWGDHCSPISDTTILSSVGTGCTHLSHVETQVPYAIVVGFSTLAGYLAAGFTMGSWIAMVLTSLGVLMLSMVLILRRERRRPVSQNPGSGAQR